MGGFCIHQLSLAIRPSTARFCELLQAQHNYPARERAILKTVLLLDSDKLSDRNRTAPIGGNGPAAPLVRGREAQIVLESLREPRLVTMTAGRYAACVRCCSDSDSFSRSRRLIEIEFVAAARMPRFPKLQRNALWQLWRLRPRTHSS